MQEEREVERIVDLKKMADEYEKMNPDDYGTSLMKRVVDLLVLVAELDAFCEDLRGKTYGGAGTGASWPGTNDGQGQPSGKRYQENVGIHIKKKEYFELSKAIDPHITAAKRSINKAIYKINSRLYPEKQSV